VIRWIIQLALASTLLTLAPPALADPVEWDPGALRRDIAKGLPLVVHVRVALCSNKQIDCGSAIAGRPEDLGHNIYWGAIFGARRFLERKGSGFERLSLAKIDTTVLERAVYRRRVSGKRWGSKHGVEQIVILDAVNGNEIDRAVTGFWQSATHGETIRIQDGTKTRELRVHVAGYVGHNRLMDGLDLPPADASDAALPSFVLACYSEQYFGKRLRAAGSRPLVTTRQLMAPEGYVLDAVLRGLGDGLSQREIRAQTVAAYAKWARLSTGVAGGIFAPAR
jgi:hypothetical protein